MDEIAPNPAVNRTRWFMETVFGWTHTRFPFQTQSTKKLNVANPPIIPVMGKAFWDINHAPKDQSNRRKYMLGYAVWSFIQ
jgi:hypothetical protein